MEEVWRRRPGGEEGGFEEAALRNTDHGETGAEAPAREGEEGKTEKETEG